jgi:hypothetical protein
VWIGRTVRCDRHPLDAGFPPQINNYKTETLVVDGSDETATNDRMQYMQAVLGPTGGRTWTLNSSRAWAGWLVALRPR